MYAQCSHAHSFMYIFFVFAINSLVHMYVCLFCKSIKGSHSLHHRLNIIYSAAELLLCTLPHCFYCGRWKEMKIYSIQSTFQLLFSCYLKLFFLKKISNSGEQSNKWKIPKRFINKIAGFFVRFLSCPPALFYIDLSCH